VHYIISIFFWKKAHTMRSRDGMTMGMGDGGEGNFWMRAYTMRYHDGMTMGMGDGAHM
jgi:hypothetical protein